MYQCSIEECQKRYLEIKEMNFETLSYYCNKCEKCGEWILKENKIVNKTYNEISIKYAEEYNNRLLNKKI